ncbi:pseudouridine synthase [Arachidicoccus ginsenosidimutans]|uniref:pseudouridine synthase n=1 Tax=Arachidicoccus sp. BS20 TaxID=1850526 RepID=UPI0007F133B5|nr:pseudouridine synthase [Arachidicoccus sp. BS20]ANI90651.1 pseudouridine synthase [Arachidicoccus sp. BS20]
MKSFRYFIVYKPYQVLTQFSPQENKQTLKDFFDVPKDVYPVGRLDYDSEGLLILTNDARLNHQLLNPKFAHEREYWVQVDGAITMETIEKLKSGVDINIDGKIYRTKKCCAEIFSEEPNVPERNPPIRFRKTVPAPWVKIILSEGKNRQVRKMFAAVGFPVLRLIRRRIENIEPDNLQPSGLLELSKTEIAKSLGIKL